jgi:hypothetical protein
MPPSIRVPTRVEQARNAIGATLRKGYAPDSPEVLDARRALNAAKIEKAIRELVDAWPPLTADQRHKLASLLRGDAA